LAWLLAAAAAAAGTQSSSSNGSGSLTSRQTDAVAAQAAEVQRLEAVLALAAKCNQALREEDWALM
jgi:hypothetical protein